MMVSPADLQPFLNPTAQFEGVDGEFACRLALALSDPVLAGFVRVGQLVRSSAAQAGFYDRWILFAVGMGGDVEVWKRTYPGVPVPSLAAKPGTSNHERGLAADLVWDRNQIDTLFIAAVLSKYGLYQAVRNPNGSVREDWHYELDPNRAPLEALLASLQPPQPKVPDDEEDDMPFAVARIYGTDTYDAQFIRYSNGEVRHLGPGEIVLFDEGGPYAGVPKVTETDRIAYHRLVRASGTNWKPSDMPY